MSRIQMPRAKDGFAQGGPRETFEACLERFLSHHCDNTHKGMIEHFFYRGIVYIDKYLEQMIQGVEYDDDGKAFIRINKREFLRGFWGHPEQFTHNGDVYFANLTLIEIAGVEELVVFRC